MINHAVAYGYLKKYKKEYYYSDAKQTNKNTLTIVITVAIVVFVLCLVPLFLEDNSSNNSGNNNNNINNEETSKDEVISSSHFSFTLDKDWQENEEYREKIGRYFVRKNDLEGNRGYIYIAIYSIDDTSMNEQEFIDHIIDFYKNESSKVEYISNDSFEVNGKKVYELVWSIEDEYGVSYETIYLTFNNNYYIMLDNLYYTEKINSEQKDVNTKILETLKWK